MRQPAAIYEVVSRFPVLDVGDAAPFALTFVTETTPDLVFADDFGGCPMDVRAQLWNGLEQIQPLPAKAAASPTVGTAR